MPNGGQATGQRVYVSAARADAQWAAWIAWQLLDLGYEVSYEEWDVVPGDNLHGWLDRTLSSARHVMIVLSRSYLAEKATPGQLSSLGRSGVAGGLVPVRIDRSEAGGLLDGIRTIDLAGLGVDEAQARLRRGFEAVGQGHNRPAQPPDFPGFPGLADELLGEAHEVSGAGVPVAAVDSEAGGNLVGSSSAIAGSVSGEEDARSDHRLGGLPRGGSQPGGDPGQGGWLGTARRRQRLFLRLRLPALIMAAAVLAGGIPLTIVLTGGGSASADVYAEAAGDPPASPDLLGVMPPEQSDVLGLTAPATSPAASGGVPSTPPGSTGTGATGGSVSGDVVGLFGGTRDDRRCDPDKLVSFLESRPDLRSEWANAVGADPDRLGEFIAGLTPVVLRIDTLVTNHGVDDDGRLRPYQAVLQAGTAVLVDRRGAPVVKCSCGNPLKAPAGTVTALADTEVKGRTWPTFSSQQVVVVQASTVTVQNFVLQQVEGRPAAGPRSGTATGPATPGPQPAPAEASPAPPTTNSPAGPSPTGAVATPSASMASTPAAGPTAGLNPGGDTPRWFARPAGSPPASGAVVAADRDFVPLGDMRWDQTDYTSRCAGAASDELSFPVRDGSAGTSDGGRELILSVVTSVSGDLVTEAAVQRRAEVAVLLRCGPSGAERYEIQVFTAGPNRIATLTAPAAHQPRVGGLLAEPFAVDGNRLRTAADYLDPADVAAPALRQEISWRWQADEGRFEPEFLATSEVARVPPTPVVAAAPATDAVLVTITAPGSAVPVQRYELRGDNGATVTATAPGEVRVPASGCADVSVTVVAIGPGGASEPAVTPPTTSCVDPGPISNVIRQDRDSEGGGDIVGRFTWTLPSVGGGRYTYRVYFVDSSNPSDYMETVTTPSYEYVISSVAPTLEGVYVAAVNAVGEGPRVRIN